MWITTWGVWISRPIFYCMFSPSCLMNVKTYVGNFFFSARSPESLPSWNGSQRPLLKNNDTMVHQRPSAVTSFVVSRNSGNSVTAKISRFQDTRGNRSPPFVSRDVNIRNSTQSVPRRYVLSISVVLLTLQYNTFFIFVFCFCSSDFSCILLHLSTILI